MKTYFTIKNSEGRYLKIRENGKSRNWVKTLKGASVGTESQMQTYLDGLTHSPYHAGCTLVKVGEADSAWKAKVQAIKKEL